MKREEAMNRSPRFSNHGVTLVELAIVIAVAGILAAVASPTVFNAIKRERARQVVNDVANQYREGRNQAMSRGEVVLVGSFDENLGGGIPGRIETYATELALPAGGFPSGSCNSATEDLTTDNCPDFAVCLDNTCEGRPARSCRELGGTPGLDWIGREVQRYEIGTRSSSNMGLRVSSGVGGEFGTFVCFNPDGRAEGMGGGVIAPSYPTASCEGDGYLVYLGALDAGPWGTYLSNVDCGSDAAEIESVLGAVIRVFHNGEISVRPPA